MERAIAVLAIVPLAACVSLDVDDEVGLSEAQDYRVSVEIPLREADAGDAADPAADGGQGRILKIDELLNARTDFDAGDFQLDEVVLVARAGEGAEGQAELLVLEWRSGERAVPEGGEEDWFEVRIPGPEEDLGGAWLLYLGGAVTVDLLVAVLEPKPRVVEQAAAAYTVYRTRTVYRERAAWPHRHGVLWLYEPARYYVYHDYGIWPYRYFIGPWDFRYYDLAYRPHRHHYGPIHRPYRGRAADRGRSGQRAAAAELRRISPQLVNLRRNHPRLRHFRERGSRERGIRERGSRERGRTDVEQRPLATREPQRLRRAEADVAAPARVQRSPRTFNRDAARASERRRAAPVAESRPSAPLRRDAAEQPSVRATPHPVSRPRNPRFERREAIDMRRSLSRPAAETRRSPRVQRPAERPARQSVRVRRDVAPPRTQQRSPRASTAPSASSAPARNTRVSASEVRRRVQQEAPMPRRSFERPTSREHTVRRASEPRRVERTQPRRAERPAVRRDSAPARVERREAQAPRASTRRPPPEPRGAETRGRTFERR